MTELGFRVIRFWNNEVLAHIDAVCERILCEIEKNPSFMGRKRQSLGETETLLHLNSLPTGTGDKRDSLSHRERAAKRG